MAHMPETSDSDDGTSYQHTRTVSHYDAYKEDRIQIEIK